MALQKVTVSFSFAKGLDTYNDPNQLQIGTFVSLQNAIFVAAEGVGKLQKRNGYAQITTLDSQSSYLTTYNGNLIAIGQSSFKSYNKSLGTWADKNNFIVPTILPTNGAQGTLNNNGGVISSFSTIYKSVQFSALSVVRSYTNQLQSDMAISSGSNLACVTYFDVGSSSAVVISSGGFTSFKYQVYDYQTGETFLGPSVIQPTTGKTQLFPARVFSLQNNFVLMFDGSVSSGASTLQYFSINKSTLAVSSASTLSTDYAPLSQYGSFDATVSSNSLYFAWASGSPKLNISFLSSSLVQGSVTSISSTTFAPYSVSVCSDQTQIQPVIYYSYSICSSHGIGGSVPLRQAFAASTDPFLNVTSSVAFSAFGSSPIYNLVTTALGGTLFTVSDTSSQSGQLGTLPSPTFPANYGTICASSPQVSPIVPAQIGVGNIFNLGVGSKPFIIGSQAYLIATYNSSFQPSYFLVNVITGMTTPLGRFAYGNGIGFYNNGAPSANVIGSTVYFSYLFKDTIQSFNKTASTSSTAIYSQFGVNQGSYNFSSQNLTTVETAGSLQINGGQLWQYDGTQPIEQNFSLFPDYLNLSLNGANSGNLAPGTYFYTMNYQWMDAKGNIHNSAPAIPQSITINTSSYSVQVFYPSISWTNKTNQLRPPKICFFRWSQGQPVFTQVTSLTGPQNAFNFALSFVDALADTSIVGNSILYTNGGIVEDVGAPATSGMAMFDDRLWLIDAEDPNTLWYSKQILEGTPVEMSDLLTFFVPPTTATGAPTGPCTALAPMDDKLIIFKNQTIYYINGVGPDNTGANNQYSNPIFAASGVGCTNQNSTVLIPQGVIFQSTTKGIWLLNRGLSIEHIGKPVELYNSSTVLSANLIPNTNQVRFVMDNGLILMYDYLVNEWSTFNNVPSLSGCTYQSQHTLLGQNGSIFQETPGVYLDGATPTVMSFQTGWISPADVQGFVNAYSLIVLGTFQSPHTYTMGIAYDYNPNIVQTSTISPTNTVGSGSQVEQLEIGFARTQCQSFQLTFNEISSGSAGAGLTISQIKLVCGVKRSYPLNISQRNKT